MNLKSTKHKGRLAIEKYIKADVKTAKASREVHAKENRAKTFLIRSPVRQTDESFGFYFSFHRHRSRAHTTVEQNANN